MLDIIIGCYNVTAACCMALKHQSKSINREKKIQELSDGINTSKFKELKQNQLTQNI